MWEPGSALAEEAQDDEIFILRCSTRYLYAPIRNWGIPALESLLVAKVRALPLGRLVQANVGHLGKQPLCQRAVCLRSQRGVPVVSSHPRVLLLCENCSCVPDITFDKQEAVRARSGGIFCFLQQKQHKRFLDSRRKTCRSLDLITTLAPLPRVRWSAAKQTGTRERSQRC